MHDIYVKMHFRVTTMTNMNSIETRKENCAIVLQILTNSNAITLTMLEMANNNILAHINYKI